MRGADFTAAREVGDGASDLENTGEGAGGEAELLEGTVDGTPPTHPLKVQSPRWTATSPPTR
jgi:hypothetical protein